MTWSSENHIFHVDKGHGELGFYFHFRQRSIGCLKKILLLKNQNSLNFQDKLNATRLACVAGVIFYSRIV